MINEILQMIIFYHMLLFTPFCGNTDIMFFHYGNSFIVTMILIFLVNIVYLVTSAAKEYLRARHFKSLKTDYDKAIENAKKN